MSDFPARSIGLCLSGGGFRASLYHLGVLRYLAEAGQLGNVSAISSVSGGSIIAGLVAAKWNELGKRNFSLAAFEELIRDPFLTQVTTRNFRNTWLLHCPTRLPKVLFRNSTCSLIDLWSAMFDEWFYGNHQMTTDELPQDLDLVVNTTDLDSAKVYRIARAYHGDNAEGYNPYADGTSVRLSDAVAASSAHFPIHIVFPGSQQQAAQDHWFMDGGVYDNTALDWYLNWNATSKPRPEGIKPPEFIIVSDASPELRLWGKSWRHSLIPMRFMGRVFDIVQEQTRRTRKDRFIEHLRDYCKLNEGIIISIDQVGSELRELVAMADDKLRDELQAVALPKQLVEERIRLVRTDLDNFLMVEADLLAYHSYSLMHIYLKVFQKDTLVAGHPVYIDDTPLWDIGRTADKIDDYMKQLDGCDDHFSRKRRWL